MAPEGRWDRCQFESAASLPAKREVKPDSLSCIQLFRMLRTRSSVSVIIQSGSQCLCSLEFGSASMVVVFGFRLVRSSRPSARPYSLLSIEAKMG